MLNCRFSKIASVALTAGVCFAGGSAMAGDPMAGSDLAKRWCVSCHATGNSAAARDIGPSFVEIANDPNRTDDRLRSWLIDPHPPMPNPGLTRIEIENVIAYLANLRTK
jgi:mono/diheme cytochrome c family protein